MTNALLPEIEAWKGKNSPIRTEKFGIGQSQKNISGEGKTLLVHFSKSNATIEWDSDQRNLLEFAESNGIIMEAGCMFGECGACSIKLVDGGVRYNYDTAAKPVKGNCFMLTVCMYVCIEVITLEEFQINRKYM